MNSDSSNQTKAPMRALPCSFSVPRDITNHQAQLSPTQPKRQSAMPPSPLNPWCIVPSNFLPLTRHQQAIASQCHSSSPSVTALVGPRDSGKSEMAAHATLQAPLLTLWLHAHSEPTLRASYISVLRQYAPQEKSLGSLTARQLAERIASLVLPQQSCQIVYEDVGVEPSFFFSNWAIPSSSTVLLTSTLPAYNTWQQDGYECILVQPEISLEDAKALLYGPDYDPLSNEGAAIQSVLNLLQNLPLAVSMAGAQRRNLGLTSEQLVQRLQEYKDAYMPRASDESSLNWFWSFALDPVADEGTRQVLSLLSTIHHDCIPEALLKPYEKILPRLLVWKIIQKQTQLGTYSIAPGLQQVTRQSHISTLGEAVIAMQSGLGTLKQKALLNVLPHLETLQSHVDHSNLRAEFPRETLADVLLQTGILLQRPPLADYARANETYRQGLQVANEHSPVAKSLYYRLGLSARLQGDHRQAKENCVRALALYGYSSLSRQSYEGGLPQIHPNTNKSDLNILSQMFHICGHASWQEEEVLEARVFFEHELAVKQALYGTEEANDRISRTLNNLASVCRDTSDLEAAREYGLQSLAHQKELDKEESLETATLLNNLGSIFFSLGAYARAEEFLTEALALKQRCYQAQQPTSGPVQNLDVAETHYNLGLLAEHLSKFDEAHDHYLASLNCKLTVYGKEAKNAEIATSLSALALCTMLHSQYKTSERYYMEALQMLREVYQGQGNMEIIRTLHGLGMLNFQLGKMHQSRQYHLDALQMQKELEEKEGGESNNPRRIQDPRNAQVSQIMQNLGNLAHNLGDFRQAKEFFSQGLKLYQQAGGSSVQGGNEQLQHMLGNLQDLSSNSNYDAARKYYESALAYKTLLYGEKSANSDLAFTLRSLALLEDNAGNHDEAKAFYKRALGMYRHIYGGKDAANAQIAGVLDGLGAVSFNLGNYTESQQWLEQGLKMKEVVYGDAQNNDLATSHVSLGTLHHTLGNYDVARWHLETACEIQLALFAGAEGEQNIELGVTANCLANLYRDFGETEKALLLYQQALEYMGKDNPYLASALIDMGEYYRSIGEYENAEACFEEAQHINKELYGEGAENAEVATLNLYLGKLYTDLGRYKEAQECLEQQALPLQRRVLGDHTGGVEVSHGEIADTLQALGDLMLAKGDPHAAKVYFEQAKAMRHNVYGNVKTLEMAHTMHSLGVAYAELHDDEKAALCQEELSELRAVAPKVSEALDQALQTAQQKAADFERNSAGPSMDEGTANLPDGAAGISHKAQPADNKGRVEGAEKLGHEVQTLQSDQQALEANPFMPESFARNVGDPNQPDRASPDATTGHPKLLDGAWTTFQEVHEPDAGDDQTVQQEDSTFSDPCEEDVVVTDNVVAAPASKSLSQQKNPTHSTADNDDGLVGTILSVDNQQNPDAATECTEASSVGDSTLFTNKEHPGDKASRKEAYADSTASQEDAPENDEDELQVEQGSLDAGSDQLEMLKAGEQADTQLQADAKPVGESSESVPNNPAADLQAMQASAQSDQDGSNQQHEVQAREENVEKAGPSEQNLPQTLSGYDEEQDSPEDCGVVPSGTTSAQSSADPGNDIQVDSTAPQEACRDENESDVDGDDAIIVSAKVDSQNGASLNDIDVSAEAPSASTANNGEGNADNLDEGDLQEHQSSVAEDSPESNSDPEQHVSQDPQVEGSPAIIDSSSPQEEANGDASPETTEQEVEQQGPTEEAKTSAESRVGNLDEGVVYSNEAKATPENGLPSANEEGGEVNPSEDGSAETGGDCDKREDDRDVIIDDQNGRSDSNSATRESPQSDDAEIAADVESSEHETATTPLSSKNDEQQRLAAATPSGNQSTEDNEIMTRDQDPAGTSKPADSSSPAEGVKKPFQRGASKRKLECRKRTCIAPKQPGEQPRMDWTDAKLVKRESARHLEQKKAREESQADGENKPRCGKGSKNLKDRGGEDDGSENSRSGKDQATKKVKPKLEKRSKSKAKVHEKKEGKPKLEKRSKSKANVQASEGEPEKQGKNVEKPKTESKRSKDDSGKGSGKATTQSKKEKPMLQGKSRSKSRGIAAEAGESPRSGGGGGTCSKGTAKSDAAAKKAAQKGKKAVAKTKKSKENHQRPEADMSKKNAICEQKSSESAAADTKQPMSKPADATPQTKDALNEGNVEVDLNTKAKSSSSFSAEKCKPAAETNERNNVAVPKGKLKAENDGETASSQGVPKEVLVNPDYKLRERLEATSIAETDVSSMPPDDGTIDPNEQTESTGQDRRDASDIEVEGKAKLKGGKSLMPEPEREKGEGQNKKGPKSAKPAQTDRALFSIEDQLDVSGKSAGSKLRKRGSMGDVTDMPARVGQQEVVSTTCGCWPFSLERK